MVFGAAVARAEACRVTAADEFGAAAAPAADGLWAAEPTTGVFGAEGLEAADAGIEAFGAADETSGEVGGTCVVWSRAACEVLAATIPRSWRLSNLAKRARLLRRNSWGVWVPFLR